MGVDGGSAAGSDGTGGCGATEEGEFPPAIGIVHCIDHGGLERERMRRRGEGERGRRLKQPRPVEDDVRPWSKVRKEKKPVKSIDKA